MTTKAKNTTKGDSMNTQLTAGQKQALATMPAIHIRVEYTDRILAALAHRLGRRTSREDLRTQLELAIDATIEDWCWDLDEAEEDMEDES